MLSFMIKAIIFDLDNTLIDFMKMKRVACEQAIDAMIDAGLSLDRKDALDKLYNIYFQEGLEDPEIFQKFLKKITGQVNYRELAHGIVAYREARTGFLKPYPGTKKTLKRLKAKGLSLAIVSDAPKLKAWIRLVNMGIDDLFDIVIAYEDTLEKKPSPKPFLLALEKLGLNPDECLMIGDMPQKDMKGAKDLYIKTCFARYGFDGKDPIVETDYVIDSIEDLEKII